MKSKFLLLLFLLRCGFALNAQNISVADFYYAENDLTARYHGTSVEDQNGNICALIKVETTEKGLWSFDVGAIGVTKTEFQNAAHPAEIWVYVPYSATWISIQHEQLGKLSHYNFPCSIDKGYTYVMKLTTGRVKTFVEEAVTQQFLTFQISPANAMLEVDGKLWEVDADGTATKFVDFGTYNYRVQAPNYQTEVGKVTVNDPDNAHKVPVRLKSDLVSVTLEVNADAEIWVNNEKKGIRTWTGALGKGTYKIECKQANHETTLTTQKITMDGQTITLPAPPPIYGSLSIESTPNYVTIYLDGKAIGETPKLIREILIGQHEVRLSKAGYADFAQNITVTKNERAQVQVALNKASKKAENLNDQLMNGSDGNNQNSESQEQPNLSDLEYRLNKANKRIDNLNDQAIELGQQVQVLQELLIQKQSEIDLLNYQNRALEAQLDSIKAVNLRLSQNKKWF